MDYEYLRASDGTGPAVLAHIESPRAIGATVINVDSVDNFPNKFIATTGTPLATGFIDPATVTEMRCHVDTGNVIIDSFEPGFSDTGNTADQILVIKQTTEWANDVTESLQRIDDDIITRADETVADHVVSGGVIAEIGSSLNASMTALVLYQAGYRGTHDAVVTRGYTASKDTYVDVLRATDADTGEVTLTLVYTEVATGAASPALAANSIRLAKVVTGASEITSVTQYGVDSLNNTIYPNGLVGSRQLSGSGLWLNVKQASNTATKAVSLSNYTNFADVGAAITFTVSSECRALVTVITAIGSSSEFEYRPTIYLNGTVYSFAVYPASPASSASRPFVRTHQAVVTLPAGANTLSAGVWLSSASGSSLMVGGAQISAIVLGQVTA